MSPRSVRSIRLRLVLALLVLPTALIASTTVTAGPATARGVGTGSAHVTFTKWIVSDPANPPSFAGVLMTGVVGGDVGAGRYLGTVLHDDLTDPGFWHADALYGFFGAHRALVARLHITENDTVDPATATLSGTVVGGSRLGQSVRGTYTVLDPCPIPTPRNVLGSACFQGEVTIGPGRG